MSASYQSLLVLALGFSVGGLLASGYQALMLQPPSFRVLGVGYGRPSLAAMSFVVFAAPFMILRNAIRAHGVPGQRFLWTMTATIVAGLWSLVSGSLLVLALGALGILHV